MRAAGHEKRLAWYKEQIAKAEALHPEEASEQVNGINAEGVAKLMQQQMQDLLNTGGSGHALIANNLPQSVINTVLAETNTRRANCSPRAVLGVRKHDRAQRPQAPAAADVALAHR